MNDTILMDKGMKCLIETLGEVGAERFITKLIREPFDYTKWQRDLFEGMTIEEISRDAAEYCKANPR
ncbi:MAG: hypothetical protein FWC55_00260 [Firmicutes bacterium]|nr:hypothetical protein [Bacillota bacterium]